ncbi:MAG: NAD(P)/FAD-dependent oxidoreductase [Bdellovibrionales bacterium]
MSKIIENLQLPLDQALEDYLAWAEPNHGEFRILKKSVDARNRHQPHFVLTVEVAAAQEKLAQNNFEIERLSLDTKEKPIIIGSGPAGLFAALRLLERGIKCRLFERGSPSEIRMKGINRYWRYGELDTRNNVCFGEGGAGLYSDGKLITRIKSEHIPYVMNRLVKFGAPQEIEYLSNPHVGSDRLRRVIPFLRKHLIENGCEIYFDTQITDLVITNKSIQGVITEKGETYHSSFVLLATGHSAEDIFHMLEKHQVFMEPKSFAMGVRIEHPQNWVNSKQYRELAEHKALGSANYKLTHHDHQTGTGVYSFCMCPGGFVLSSSTDNEGLVSNGMSNFNRNSPWANSAVVVTVDQKSFSSSSTLAGLWDRKQAETRALNQVLIHGGNKQLPAQKLEDFFNQKLGPVRKGSSPSGEIAARVDQILEKTQYLRLLEGLKAFDQKMKGFFHPEAQIYGVESRTSCPVRITRNNETYQSVSHSGLYPVGEGAGYAGGITSAACDGIRVADQIYQSLKSQNLSVRN